MRPNASILSPLRYPGAKRRLAAYLSKTLEVNGLKPELFVEPFAGGASISLRLLNDGKVDSIGLADADPLVASFWKTLFFDTDWLIKQVETVEITLANWDRKKKGKHTTRRDQALACLFLNRTSFSGILAPSAGPIGGRAEKSPYAIDCRFPRETLVRRIRQAAALRDRVRFVWCTSWMGTVGRVMKMRSRTSLPTDIFFYFDPPFIDKASRLYNRWFKEAEHLAFRDFVVSLTDPWLISYDSAPQVYSMYAHLERMAVGVEVLYSSASGDGRRADEAIVTNLRVLPDESRLWRRTQEWKPCREDGEVLSAAAS